MGWYRQKADLWDCQVSKALAFRQEQVWAQCLDRRTNLLSHRSCCTGSCGAAPGWGPARTWPGVPGGRMAGLSANWVHHSTSPELATEGAHFTALGQSRLQKVNILQHQDRAGYRRHTLHSTRTEPATEGTHFTAPGQSRVQKAHTSQHQHRAGYRRWTLHNNRLQNRTGIDNYKLGQDPI